MTDQPEKAYALKKIAPEKHKEVLLLRRMASDFDGFLEKVGYTLDLIVVSRMNAPESLIITSPSTMPKRLTEIAAAMADNAAAICKTSDNLGAMQAEEDARKSMAENSDWWQGVGEDLNSLMVLCRNCGCARCQEIIAALTPRLLKEKADGDPSHD